MMALNPDSTDPQHLFTAYVAHEDNRGWYVTTVKGSHLFKTLSGLRRNISVWEHRPTTQVRYWRASLLWEEIDADGNLLE